MKLSGTKTGSVNQYNGLGDQLYDIAGARPTLDLNFAGKQSLNDQTTGNSLVTHTRASSATYVGGDGLIRNAVTNLLLQSEAFDNAYWNKVLYGAVTPNDITAPNGTVTADKLYTNTTGTGAGIVRRSFTYSALPYTLSVYAKADEYDYLMLRVNDSNNHRAVFNLSTGVVSNTTLPSGGSASIEPISNGWYRCQLNTTTLTAGSHNTEIWCRSTNTVTTAGDASTSGHGIYIWGAQLEQSSTVGEYVKTTSTKNSAPRFDHDPETGESLGLLVEESRTNYNNHSTYYAYDASETDPRGWADPLGNATFTANKLAPDGTSTAVQWENTTGNQAILRVVHDSITPNGTDSYTYSFWAKLISKSDSHGVVADWQDNNTFDYTNELVEGEWVRITHSFVPSATAKGFVDVISNTTTNAVIQVWGVQVEKGSFPTSYIRTNGSTKSRNPDITQISGNDFGTFNWLQYSEEFDQASWVNISAGDAVIQTNQEISPAGTLTADKFQDDTTNSSASRAIYQQVVATQGTTYTHSVYAKAAGINWVLIQFQSFGSFSSARTAYFNLSDETIGTVTAGTTATITSVGDGWYRCAITATADATSSLRARIFLAEDNNDVTYSGTVGNGIYLWGAQLEESSTATPYVKSDVTWTSRASNATYYDKDGVLRKSSYNLMAYSQDATQWVTEDATVTTTTVEAPDGSLTAIAFEEDLVTAPHNVRAIGTTVPVANTQYTMSVFAKAGVRDYVTLGAEKTRFDDSVQVKQTFDITNGTLGDPNGDVDDAVITPVGNGWYRCSVTFTSGASPSGNGFFRAYSNNSSDSSNNKAGVSGIALYLWGFQLETGPYAGDYAKTEGSAASTARTSAYLPDASGNFVSAGELLLEDAGTNLITYSEEFDQATLTRSSVTPNAITAPDGNLTADKLVLTATGHAHAEVYTGTVSAGNAYGYINLNTGVSIKQVGSWKGSTTTDVGNGWWYITVTSNSNYTLSFYAKKGEVDYATWQLFNIARIGVSNTNNIVNTSASGGIYVWGAQVEQNSYATSYIPTQGSSATRAADVSSSSSNTFGNSWYNQDQGTVFAEYSKLGTQPASTAPINGTLGTFSDGSSTNSMSFIGGYSNPNQLRLDVSSNSVVQSQGGFTSNFVPNVMNKLAAAITANNLALSFTGTITATQSSVSMPLNIDRFEFGVFPATSGHALCGHVKQFTYWPTRLSNETLTQITEPKAAYDLSSLKLDLNFAENKSLVDNVSGNDLVTFTRSSNATYVGSDGLIKTATTNLLTYSEEFDQSTWIKANLTVTSNAAVAPDGTLTADKLVEGTSANYKTIDSTVTYSNSTTYTFSVYAKAAENDSVEILFAGGGQFAIIEFNLTDGTASVSGQNNTWSNISGTSSYVGNGWYRCSITATSSSAVTSNKVLIRHTNATDQGDGTSGVFVWGAQLETGCEATPYIKTTSTTNSTPRFDHDPDTLESLGLLIEESRTNLLTNSNHLGGSSVIVSTDTSITAPDGSLTAQKVQINKSFGTGYSNSSNSITNTSGSTVTYCWSIFIKRGSTDGASVQFGIYNQGNISYNFITDTITNNSATGFGRILYPNGWVRLFAYDEVPNGQDINLINVLESVETQQGLDTFIYQWGMQVEAGSFPTSYIPTCGSTATRAADITSITGSNFTSFYNQSEGTAFASIKGYSRPSGNTRIFGFNDGTTNNRMELLFTGSIISAFGVSSGSTIFNLNVTGFTNGAFAYAQDDIAFSADGKNPATNNSANIPTVTQSTIGNWFDNTGQLNGTIKRLSYWNDRLSNEHLTKLTS